MNKAQTIALPCWLRQSAIRGMTSRWSPTAFTLVELLVVTAIIAVLAGLMLPALKQVRKQGRCAICVNNLRQVGLALRMYADDNNGYAPGACTDPAYPASSFWQYKLVLTGYIPTNQVITGKPSLFVCPDQDPKTFAGNWYTYGLWDNDLTYVAASPANAFRMDGFSRPADQPIAADTRRAGGVWPQSYTLAKGALNGNPQSTGGDKIIHLRHSNRGNVLFADGSVRPVDAAYLQSIQWDWCPDVP